MARPRLLLNREEVVDAFEGTGSIRGAAKKNGVARSVAARALKQAGIELPDREEGYRRSRLLKSDTPTKSNVIKVEQWGKGKPGDIGVSVIPTIETHSITLCIVDHCTEEATQELVCGRHAAMMAHPAKGHCVYPKCGQDATMGDPLCYFHGRKLRGEV